MLVRWIISSVLTLVLLGCAEPWNQPPLCIYNEDRDVLVGCADGTEYLALLTEAQRAGREHEFLAQPPTSGIRIEGGRIRVGRDPQPEDQGGSLSSQGDGDSGSDSTTAAPEKPDQSSQSAAQPVTASAPAAIPALPPHNFLSLRRAPQYVMPVPEYARFTSGFNPRRVHPVTGRVRPHKGVDFAAPMGTPIYAAEEGVIGLRQVSRSFGNFIVISHRDNQLSKYAHLSRFAPDLRVGDVVLRGELIGYMGSTGMSTGSHLHFEIWIDNVAVDPLPILPRN